MARAPYVIGATVASTAGVLAFHPRAAATSAPAPAATTAARTSVTTASTTSNASARVATGDPVPNQYGTVQVRVTVAGKRIVRVEALQLPQGDSHSAEISSAAEPVLRQEILSRQTARVDAVSGASFTSASYLESAQSALAKLGFTPARR